MDKYEYRAKTEQMLAYAEQKSYQKAMSIADTIDWRKVKNTAMLSTVSEIYENAGELGKARDTLFIAYDKAPSSRKVVYRLGIISLKLGHFDEAADCYEEFVKLAPKDPNQYILRYKILKAQKAPVKEQIEALEDFKHSEYVEKWAYELARLYAEAGMTSECLDECDDLILWFNEGEYVEKALRLKNRYAKLTKSQQAKLDMMEEYRAAGMEYSTVMPEYDSEPDIEHEEVKELEPQEEYKVQEKDYSIYDTQNIQAQLAESMAKILGGINGPGEEEAVEPEITEPAGIEEPSETTEFMEPEEDTWEEPEETEEPEEQPEAEKEPEEAEEQPEVEKESEPDSIEDKYKDIYEGIDEPTKEIRINTLEQIQKRYGR